jgi:hypothetical protein
VVAVKEDGVGAEASRGAQRHGGVDTEFAGFVAGGGDDAALVGASADDNGLAAEVGALEEFDGNEESVHVDVEDGGVGGSFRRIGGVVLGSEACEVRHGISVRLQSGGGNERVGVGLQDLDMRVWSRGLMLKSARLGRRPLQEPDRGHLKVAAT